jgi:hypothetical protein
MDGEAHGVNIIILNKEFHTERHVNHRMWVTLVDIWTFVRIP